jgi:hypothetical protein
MSIIQKGISGFFSFGGSSEPKPKPIVIDEDDEEIIVKSETKPKKTKKTLQVSGTSGPVSGASGPVSGASVDDEDVVVNKNYNLALSILKNSLYEIKNKKVYVVDLKELKHLNLFPYRHQREYNQDHVDVLKKGLIQTGYLYHPIVLIHIPQRKEISIIDGQHRFKALKSILESVRETQGLCRDGELEVNIKVQIEMLECEDDDNKIMNIYKNVNTCQPIDMNKIVLEQDYVKVIQKLKTKFGKNVINDNVRNAKHYLIESKLKTELLSHNLLIKYSEDELIKRIIRMNDDLKEQQILLGKLTEEAFKKCEKNNFWLGTDFPAWLKEL